MKVLGIETSCDETAAAVLDTQGPEILSSVVYSQIAAHKEFGGVVPEIASREHSRHLLPVIGQALEQAGLKPQDLGGLAVTYGPGLAGCLLVGLSVAKGLALSLDRPFIGVNHLEGHLLAPFLDNPKLEFPFLGLVVSGGHTSLYEVRAQEDFRLLGKTRDDAAGEAYDKVAKLLGLEYPGGPALDAAARAFQGKPVEFPLAGMKDHSLDFSFSGLKTAVLVFLENAGKRGENPDKGAVAAGFQEAVKEALVRKTLKAASSTGLKRLALGGGVARNAFLRRELARRAGEAGVEVYFPSPDLCMDNAAMIAYAGGLRLSDGQRSPWDLGVAPNLKL